MKRPIAEAWTSYVHLVIPPEANDVQMKECRKAFYAGAMAYSTLFKVLGKMEIPEEIKRNVIANIAMDAEKDMEDFRKEIEARKA